MAVWRDSDQRQDIIARCLIAVLSVAVACAAVASIPREFAAHKLAAQGAGGLYRNGQFGLSSPVASASGTYAKLHSCDAALNGLETLLQPKVRRADIAKDCLIFATEILVQSPALSLAHLVKALAFAEIGDMAGARQALLLSEYSGSGSISNAQRRAALWTQQFARLSSADQTSFGRDLIRLSGNSRGLRWIAGQYTARQDMRPFITKVMQTLPAAQQAAFLSALRKAAK